MSNVIYIVKVSYLSWQSYLDKDEIDIFKSKPINMIWVSVFQRDLNYVFSFTAYLSDTPTKVDFQRSEKHSSSVKSKGIYTSGGPNNPSTSVISYTYPMSSPVVHDTTRELCIKYIWNVIKTFCK